jgi:gluconolactonase
MLAALIFSLLAAGDLSAEETALLKTFREEFIAVTPGEGKFPRSFKMGEEGATREVTLTRKFSIAKYEVPQNLWEAVMGSNPSKWKGKRNSVEMLSLDEAKAFCHKATERMRSAKLIDSGEEIRLPTEEEWEYTARCGTTTKYSFGDDAKEINDYAWHTGNASGNDPPVGAKKPNGWGLYDVHGYLWEWVVADKTAEGSGVLRGGSWKDAAEKLTSGYRRVDKASLQDDAVGLRCVLCAVAEEKPVELLLASSKLDLLWGEGEFTEGPALAPDGSIFFSDIGNAIYRYEPKIGKTELFRKPSGRSNGLMFNQEGDLIAAEGANTGGNRRISVTSGIKGGKDGEAKALSTGFEGKKFNSPNDLAIDGDGNVYFSDPRYVGSEPRELDFEAVFFVKPDGTTTVATRDLQKPNGILVSPDGKHVYVSDNNAEGNRQQLTVNVEQPGKLTNKKVLHDFVAGRGIDGMTLDTAGNIYATAGTGEKAGVYVFSPSGKQMAMIPTPGDPTNCLFGGGDDSGTLYITAATKGGGLGPKYGLFRIELKAKGYHVVKLEK